MEVHSEKLDNNHTIQIFDILSAIDEKLWNSINESIPFYQSHRFLSVIEDIQKNLQFRYVLISKEDKVVAALYVQLFDFSFRNLVNYSNENSHGWKSGFKKYISQKNTKLLNLGDVFFTGDKGIISMDDTPIILLIPKIFKVIQKTLRIKNRALRSLLIFICRMKINVSTFIIMPSILSTPSRICL